jgi:hypothetical protein
MMNRYRTQLVITLHLHVPDRTLEAQCLKSTCGWDALRRVSEGLVVFVQETVEVGYHLPFRRPCIPQGFGAHAVRQGVVLSAEPFPDIETATIRSPILIRLSTSP